MALKFLFWIYLINAIHIIIYEIDSAYWKERELFKLSGGIGVFWLDSVPLRVLRGFKI